MSGTTVTTTTFVPPTNPNQSFVVDNSTYPLFVDNGATVNSPVAVDGGIIFDEVGGTVNNAQIGTGGELRAFGGTVNATEVAGGGKLSLFGNAGLMSTAKNTIVDSNGEFDIGVSGGAASSSNNTIHGLEIVSYTSQGGTDTGSTVTGQNSFMLINPGGVASQETVTNGGGISVSTGATLSEAVVTGTNSFVSASGSGTSGINVSDGGTLTVNGGASVSNDTVGTGGVENVFGVENSTTISGGDVFVQAGASFGRVTFNDASSPTTTSTLSISGTTPPTGVVSGLGPKDVIDLQSLGFAAGGSATLGSNDVLTVTENGKSIALQLDPSQSYVGDYFTQSSDGAGGTDVALVKASSDPKEVVTLSTAEKTFRREVAANVSPFDPNPFSDIVSLIQNTPQAYLSAVRSEAKDPLLLAAVSDTATGQTKRNEIGNAALQLAAAFSGIGMSNATQSAAAVVAGAVHDIQTGNIGINFVNNGLQTKAGAVFAEENAVRPF